MEILTFVLLVFAVYRLATDFAWMSGPFHVFDYIRGWSIQKFGIYSWITEGVNCPICLSFWFALPLIYTHDAVWWLAVAGASAFLSRVSAPSS
jgi:hypothetical protein